MKYQIIGLIVALLAGFGLGRYVTPTKEVRTETQAKTVDNKIVKTETRTEQDKQPNGEIKTITVTDTTTQDESTVSTQTETKSTPVQTKRLNVSALAAVAPSSGLAPLYGVSVTKDVIGPVSVGGFLLTNGTIGVSVGISF